jgi:hypothetical protein
LPSALSQHFAISASFIASVQAWPLSFIVRPLMPLHTSRSLAIAPAIALSLIACGNPAEHDRIPAGWSIDEMSKASFYDGEIPTEARILTWQILEDDRPLYIESCITWFRFKKGGKDQWRLSHLYRHPKNKSLPIRWNISMVYDAPQIPQQDFDHPPTESEVDRFLLDTWWAFHPDKGWKLIDSEVCSTAWVASIGSKPTKSYSSMPAVIRH